MQTILGAGGIIGIELAKNLPHYTNHIRLVSRNPKKVNPNDEVMLADLLDGEQVLKAVQGSEVAYLTVGLPYNLGIWQTQWPVIMSNVIEACIRHNTKLVFFDNAYSYGRVKGWMTEDTPMSPSSKKGEVRKKIADMILGAVRMGSLQAIIARAADFYGPNTPHSFVNVMVFEHLREGEKAQWFINDNVRHSLTYTPDAGRATAILGNTAGAYNQVWHLPTDRNVLTGREFIEKVAQELGVKPRYTVLPRWIIRWAGPFDGIVRESIELFYQNANDYLFDSSKFEKVFDIRATPYSQGIRETVESMK